MTISNEINVTGPVEVVLPTQDEFFYLFDDTALTEEDFEVVKTDSIGQLVDLSYPADYAVDLSLNKITTTVALVTGEKLTIKRATPNTQTVDLDNQGEFNIEDIETAMDRIVLQVQDLREEVDRSLKVGLGSTFDPSTVDLDNWVLRPKLLVEASQIEADALTTLEVIVGDTVDLSIYSRIEFEIAIIGIAAAATLEGIVVEAREGDAVAGTGSWGTTNEYEFAHHGWRSGAGAIGADGVDTAFIPITATGQLTNNDNFISGMFIVDRYGGTMIGKTTVFGNVSGLGRGVVDWMGSIIRSIHPSGEFKGVRFRTENNDIIYGQVRMWGHPST